MLGLLEMSGEATPYELKQAVAVTLGSFWSVQHAQLYSEPERLAKAEKWFRRYGALTVIFGRHVPGFRIPVTVLAATTGVPYRIFAPSVAISTAVWAAIGLWIGVTFGQSIGNLLARYPWIYLVALGLVIVAIAVALVRLWRVSDDAPPSIEHSR